MGVLLAGTSARIALFAPKGPKVVSQGRQPLDAKRSNAIEP